MLVGTPIVQSESLTILCGGVGYGVMVNERTRNIVVQVADTVTLHVHTHVREDLLELYGFSTIEDKKMFEMLLSVSGVGPKTALTITNVDVSAIHKAVEEGNVSFFSSFSRVGKKLAQKIIIELKPKLGSMRDLDLSTGSPQTVELQEALMSLGYTEGDIRKAIQSVDAASLTIQEAIKQSIRLLTR